MGSMGLAMEKCTIIHQIPVWRHRVWRDIICRAAVVCNAQRGHIKPPQVPQHHAAVPAPLLAVLQAQQMAVQNL